MTKFHVGEHVQWTYRSGTRAGFVSKICESAEEIPDNMRKSYSRSHSAPFYVIKQEKNNELILKSENMLQPISGEEKMSTQEIIERDHAIKYGKRGGKRKMEEAEPKSNRAAKTQLAGHASRTGRRGSTSSIDSASRSRSNSHSGRRNSTGSTGRRGSGSKSQTRRGSTSRSSVTA